MSRKRDKIKGLLGLKGNSSSSAPAPTSASVVGSSVPMVVLPAGAAPAPTTVPASQVLTPTTQNNPSIDKTWTWWREHRQGLMSSLESALTIAEKALVVVPPAQAVVGAAGAALKDLRLMDENKTTIEEIVDRVDEIIADFVGFTFPSSIALPASISPDAVVRIDKFNERLSKITTSATGHAATNRNSFQRLLDAERIAEELGDAWRDVSLAYDELITATVLGTETKVVGVHARVENVQERVEDVHERVEEVRGGVTDVQHLVSNVQMRQTAQKDDALLDRLQPVKSAFHDTHGAAPACLEGTRTQLLDDISVWMADPSTKLVYWLTGVAGTGKTTIAQSVASIAEERKCLAATFFFSRTAGSVDRRRAAAVIPTVAYQLADRHDIFRDRICGVISSDRDVRERQIARQAKALLTDALEGGPRDLPLPLLIVLDALDECDKENGREGGPLIPVLLHSLEKLPFSVKLFITSRPEPSIRNMFGRADVQGSTVGLALHRDIEHSIVRDDIGRYLRHEFDKLAHDRSVPLPFPSDLDFQTLVDRAGNLFIYVRTIIMYVSSEVEDPIDQLADVLRADADRASEQFADLDMLYTQVLAKALDGVGRSAAAQRHLRDVLASLVLVQESLPVAALAALTGVEERQCKMTLRCLSSVLLYEHTSHESVRLIHPSFPDFLTREGRCTDARFFVNSAQYHSMLALRCLQIMNTGLRRNICDLRDPFLFNCDVPDLSQRLESNASAQLRYACKYWHIHLQSAGFFHADLITVMDGFCTRHLLHWLELLSLINEVSVALRDLPLLLIYLESCEEIGKGRIHTLLTDLERLLLVYRLPIIRGALHVYWSALVTMPSCLLLEETSPHDGHGIPLLVTNRAPGWGLREKILEDSHSVDGIAYSPDGNLIATVRGGSHVRVWDVATSTMLHRMSVFDTGATSELSSIIFGPWPGVVAFSPSSRWITSASNCTVRLWDTITGSPHHIMRGHTDLVTCVAFSPDGTSIGSGSNDGTLRIWDASTGHKQLVMTSDSTPITSLAFAPNGQTVVSASKDSALRFWNALTGTKLHVLESGEDSLSCVTFSPNGEIIAMGSLNGTIQLWSVTNSTRQYTLKGHIGPIYSLSFSPDSRSLISCGRHGSARIWHVKTGLEERSLIDAVDPVAYSPDGNSIAMGLRTGSVRICDANTSVVAPPIPEDHQAVIKTVVFSPDGHLIASGSFDQTVRIWDATTGTERHIMEVGDPVCSISFSPNGRMVACGQENGTVQAWDVVSGLRQSSMMGQHACVVSFVDFSSDGNSIVSYSSEDGTAQVSDVATGAEQHVLTHPIDKNRFATGRCVAFSANSKEVILRGTYGRDMVIGLWDLTTTQPEYTELTPPRERTRTTDELHISELEYHFRGPESAWILCYIGQEKLTYVCWLPPKRRGILEYSGTKVCIGAKDGTITILDFSPVDILQQIV